ncbi:hypothetical protein Tco_0936346 [Tanacetum coccineum]
MLVRQAYLPIALDTESKPLEDPLETKEPQPLSPTSAPPSLDYTLAIPYTSNELKPFETFETRVTSHYSTSRSHFTTISLEATTYPDITYPYTSTIILLPQYCTDGRAYISSYETPSSSSSPTLPSRKRYRGTYEIIADTKSESDESEDEVEDEPLGLGHRVARRRAFERAGDTVPSTYETLPSPVGTPTSPEWFQESPPVSPIIPSPVATLAPAASLDDGDLLEIGAQLELHGTTVCEEILSRRFRLRNLERAQEETEITLGTVWRPILALETWAGYTNAQRGALWQSIYEDRREIYDLRRHHTADQREMQELKDRIDALERRMDG